VDPQSQVNFVNQVPVIRNFDIILNAEIRKGMCTDCFLILEDGEDTSTKVGGKLPNLQVDITQQKLRDLLSITNGVLDPFQEFSKSSSTPSPNVRHQDLSASVRKTRRKPKQDLDASFTVGEVMISLSHSESLPFLVHQLSSIEASITSTNELVLVTTQISRYMFFLSWLILPGSTLNIVEMIQTEVWSILQKVLLQLARLSS
jgi:hypothetical protein